MANTIMSAKNTFTEGLIMDFAPDNTQATCLTSALNATLLTFNGNELSLQNDMGNGRVETARLPEGYIPVGTCEFGDIIYIVSYNPLTNKSQIGCFPSPERNISSEEIGDMNQTLSYKDFQEIDNGVLTGKFINTSVKKVLVNKNLNPGDKYIIYTSEDSEVIRNNNLKEITYDNEPEDHKSYVKLKVISIDDTGKITDLDSTTVTYKLGDFTHFIQSIKDDNDLSDKPDIDSYRNALSSGWSIFNSKVSGKLVIFAELVMPESFSCEYYLDYDENGGYHLSLKPFFGEEENIVKAPYLLVKSIPEEGITSSITNATIFEIPKLDENNLDLELDYEVDTITVTEKKGVYTLEVCPVMPYGIIDSLKLTFIIDFNKIGSGEIELNRWKYYNQENVSTFSYGFNAYLQDKETIDTVVMHFYDGNGLVAEYKLKDTDINSGIYTENIGLNGNVINAALSKYKSELKDDGTFEKVLIKHKKTDEVFERTDDDTNDLKNDDNYYCINEVDEDGNYILEDGKLKYYLNDAGILYSNMLYLVKIMIYAKRKTVNGDETRNITLYRWYWTTTMYNEYYHSIEDFNELKFQLPLSMDVIYATNENYKWETKEINNLEKPVEESFSANILYIGNGDGNINSYILPKLQNDYGCFSLYHFLENDNGEKEDNFKNFTVDIYYGENVLNNINADLYDYSDRDSGILNNFLILEATTTTKANQPIEIPETLNESPLNSFNVIPLDNFEKYDENYIKKSVSLSNLYEGENPVPVKLNLQAVLFNKAYAAEEYSTYMTKPVYVPIINDLNDLDLLGLTYYNGKLGFKMAMNLNQSDEFSATNIYQTDLIFDTPNNDDELNQISKSVNVNTSQDADFIDNVWNKFKDYMPTFFPVYIGGNKNVSKYYLANNSGITSIDYDWVKNRADKLSDYDGTSGNITAGNEVFDINSNGLLEGLQNNNSITFLGVKYKDGMTLINSAMVDSTAYKNTFLLTDVKFNSFEPYSNLAYLLYLILSNTYHKNKRTDDREINIKNFVRNAQYEAQLRKTIYYHLKVTPFDQKVYPDVAIYKTSFKTYIDTIENIIKDEENSDKEKITEEFGKIKNNVTLEFINYLHQSDLQIDVKSLPMSFLKSEQDAYFLRNGNLIGTYNLGEGLFYIYKDEELEPFLSKGILYFEEEATNENFKRITNAETLTGCNTILGEIKTENDVAKDIAMDKIVRYIMSYSSKFKCETEHGIDRSALAGEAYVLITDRFNAMYKYFDDNGITINGKSIKELVNITFILDNNTVRTLLFIYDGLITFEYKSDDSGEYYYDVGPRSDLSISMYSNIHFSEGAWGYYINHNFDLTRNFIYDNGLILNPASSHSHFGIRADGKKYGYTGFLQDVILDTNYQIK